MKGLNLFIDELADARRLFPVIDSHTSVLLHGLVEQFFLIFVEQLVNLSKDLLFVLL